MAGPASSSGGQSTDVVAALAVSETTLQQVGDLLRRSHLARKREADLAETTQTHAGPQFDASGMKGEFHGIGSSPKDYSKDNFYIIIEIIPLHMRRRLSLVKASCDEVKSSVFQMCSLPTKSHIML